eukprot:g1828.t1
MTKNQRKACRYGSAKEETAKNILRAKFVQDGWYLRGVRKDETVTNIIEEHTGRVLRHSFEIKAPYWNATYKYAPFPLAVAGGMPGDIQQQTWRPYPTQYGAQAAMGAWLAKADFCSLAVISRDDNVIVHAVPHHAELGAYIFEKARAVAEETRQAQLQRFITIYKNHLQNFEIIPREHAPAAAPHQPKRGKRKRKTKKTKKKKQRMKRKHEEDADDDDDEHFDDEDSYEEHEEEDDEEETEEKIDLPVLLDVLSKANAYLAGEGLGIYVDLITPQRKSTQTYNRIDCAQLAHILKSRHNIFGKKDLNLFTEEEKEGIQNVCKARMGDDAPETPKATNLVTHCKEELLALLFSVDEIKRLGQSFKQLPASF